MQAKQKQILAYYEPKIKQTASGYYIRLDGGKQLKRANIDALKQAIVDYETTAHLSLYDCIKAELDYLSDRGAIEDASYCKYNNDLKRFFGANTTFLKGIDTIDDKALSKALDSVCERIRPSQKTWDALKSQLNRGYRYARRENIPTLDIRTFLETYTPTLDKVKIRKSERHFQDSEIYTTDEAKLIYDYLIKDLTANNTALLVDLFTGLREGEVAALDITDINLKERYITIKRDETRTKDNKIVIKEAPKTSTGYRKVYFNDTLKSVLKAYIDGLDYTEGFLFLGKYKQRVRGNTIAKHLAIVCKYLNIPFKPMQSLRAYYITSLKDAGCDDKFITEQSGHRNISTTNKYYQKCRKTQNAKREAIDNVNFF